MPDLIQLVDECARRYAAYSLALDLRGDGPDAEHKRHEWEAARSRLAKALKPAEAALAFVEGLRPLANTMVSRRTIYTTSDTEQVVKYVAEHINTLTPAGEKEST
jgi:hypothetical protein